MRLVRSPHLLLDPPGKTGFITVETVSTPDYSWPTFREIGLAAVLSLIVTAVDLHFSKQLGLLAYPPYYDGIGYIVYAKKLFYTWKFWLVHPRALIYELINNRDTPLLKLALPVPLWVALMLLSFTVLGEGEWQAYSVRFWPTFLLILLVVWVVRRHGDTRLAIVAALFTALLPTISVGLNASAWEYFTGVVTFSLEWYLADLRPDLLFTVLLLWAVVSLIERAHKWDRQTLLVSGSFAGLALLAKPSATPILFYGWGLAALYSLIINRTRGFLAIKTALWGLLPFGILTIPWVLMGGMKWFVEYYHGIFGPGVGAYAIPNTTLTSELKYYWILLPSHIGYAGILILVFGLLWLMFAIARGQKDQQLFGYLGLSLALYALVSATPPKNLFLGLPYYLLLWLFAWKAFTPFVKRLIDRGARTRLVLIAVAGLYCFAVVTMGFYALQNWRPVEREWGLENRAVTMQIAQDLAKVLSPQDRFTYLPAYGFPAALEYYMVNSRGVSPEHTSIDTDSKTTVSEFIESQIAGCGAVLVYEGDVAETNGFFPTYPTRWPYLRGVKDWVQKPESGYRLAKVYHFSDRTAPQFATYPEFAAYRFGDGNHRSFTIQLYLRKSVGPISLEGGIESKPVE